jgi:hypothetical protein
MILFDLEKQSFKKYKNRNSPKRYLHSLPGAGNTKAAIVRVKDWI